MPNKIVSEYLKHLKVEMKRNGTFSLETFAEIESHLLDAVEVNLLHGLNQTEAEEEALRRFGSVKLVSSMFEKERISVMQKILLSFAVCSGLFMAYIDSRPTWDDTGITAGAILLVCGMVALLGYRRPWLLALAVGIWIPLYGYFVARNYGSILALLIAFIGAYTGWAFRTILERVFRPA